MWSNRLGPEELGQSCPKELTKLKQIPIDCTKINEKSTQNN